MPALTGWGEGVASSCLTLEWAMLPVRSTSGEVFFPYSRFVKFCHLVAMNY